LRILYDDLSPFGPEFDVGIYMRVCPTFDGRGQALHYLMKYVRAILPFDPALLPSYLCQMLNVAYITALALIPC
jgi:hypothetical protein